MVCQNNKTEKSRNQISSTVRELQLWKECKSWIKCAAVKSDTVMLLVKWALNTGICADYVLMDIWFEADPRIGAILEEGLDVIGMVKHLNQCYSYQGRIYPLSELQKFVCFNGGEDDLGSLCAATKSGIPVKLVFMRDRSEKNKCLYLLSTDCSLSDRDIVNIYGKG